MSAMPSFLFRAAAAMVVMPLAMPRMFSPSASRSTGTTRPCWSRSTAMPRLTYGCRVIVLASMSIEELTVGKARSASTDGPGDERQVGQRRPGLLLEPVLVLAAGPARRCRSRPRSRSTRDAGVGCDSIMPGGHGQPHPGQRARPRRAGRSAGRRRGGAGAGRRRVRPAPRQRPGGRGGRSGRGGGRRGGPGAAAGDAASTSSRRIRPPAPVPWMAATSRPSSATSRRTSGDSTRPVAVAGSRRAGRRRCRGRRGGRRRRSRRRRRGRAAAGRAGLADPGQRRCRPARSRPRRPGSPAAPRRTGWGSPSRPCRWTPRTAGRRTRPCRRPFLSQLPMVPSVTVSPSLGIVMSCTSPVGAP